MGLPRTEPPVQQPLSNDQAVLYKGRKEGMWNLGSWCPAHWKGSQRQAQDNHLTQQDRARHMLLDSMHNSTVELRQ